jgi:two-component system CheB/CheR fusion protein
VVSRDAADAVRSLLEARGVAFDAKIDDAPLWIDGDPARLQQIQVNLLSNAAKYTPRGGHVALEVGRDDGHAVIRVRDDGAGIAPDMLGTVFELFVQSNRTLDRAEGGIGVGLTLVKSLVEMHGGSVSAFSEGEGKGSEFVVRLPLSRAAPEGEPTTARSLPQRRERRGNRVVVVEDNVDSCQMLCSLLEMSGFECRSANDGVSGLTLVREWRPDVALVDVGLPGIDGFEIARRLRSEPGHRDTFLVALTGYGQPNDRARANEVGFDEHVVKPVHPDELLGLLGARVRRRGDASFLDGAPPSHATSKTGADPAGAEE